MRADLTMRTVDPDEEPEGRRCSSGHEAKRLMWIDGVGFRPNRLFMVSGPTLPKERHGIYCEECLTKANLMAKEKE